MFSYDKVLHCTMSSKRKGVDQGPRCYNWCFTDNNMQSPVLVSFTQNPDIELPKGVKYLIFSMEEGESKTKHYQGYISFEKQMRMTQVKSALDCKSLHLEKSRGTPQENKDYIAHIGSHAGKDGLLEGPWEFGQPPLGQGHRSDRDALIGALLEGKSVKDASLLCPHYYIAHHSGISKFEQLHIKPSVKLDLEVFVLWGPSGTGKTRTAFESSNSGSVSIISGGTNNNLWWDEYDNRQEVIILDEFRGNYVRHQLLLKICDVYPFKVDVKGGRVWNWWKKVYITSNIPPEDWYRGVHDWWTDDCPFKRRVLPQNIIYMGTKIKDGTHQSEEVYRDSYARNKESVSRLKHKYDDLY